MKTNRNPSFWRRGLALLLAVCLAAGYVPVPGYAEGCTHEHGEECYEVTTECVHTHDESCWSDPALVEAGEEPDACGHECTEETGCVVRVLNCGHVHDEACGEGVEVQEEEPKEEPQEEPEPQPEEPEGEEEPKEEPKGEPQPKTVTAWTWVDEAEALDPETGKLCLVASEEAPVSFEQIVEVLPRMAEATVDGEGETLPLAAWTCAEYPEDGAYQGSFVFEAELPEGYALGDGVEALDVVVEFGGAVMLAENAVGVIVDGVEGKYATFDEALEKTIAATGESVTVKLYEDSERSEHHDITRDVTIDLNGNGLEEKYIHFLRVKNGATLTLEDSKSGGTSGICASVDSENTGNIVVKNGEWGSLFIAGGGLTVKNGRIEEIYLKRKSQILGGSVGVLRIYEANLLILSGGSFNMILSKANEIGKPSPSIPAADLLAPGYAFRQNEDQKLLRYKDLPTLDDYTVLQNVTAVKCQSHVFETGNPNCIYCNTLCTHPTVNQTTGACESCGAVLYDAAVVTNLGTEQEQVTLYEKVSDAFDAAAVGFSQKEIRLLRDAASDVASLRFPYKTDLNGNGFTLRGAVTVGEAFSSGSIENITLLPGDNQETSLQMESDDVKLGAQCTVHGLLLKYIKTYDVVKDGFALYTDAQHTKLADAATSLFTGTLYTGEHTHDYSEKGGSCDCGKTVEAKVTSGGKTTFYESVRDAISAANGSGGVVTVFQDLNFPQIGRLTGSMTVDLNGFAWYTRNSNSLFIVAGGDGTEVIIQNGRIESWNSANGAVYLQGGSLVIEGTAVLDGYTNPAITVTGGSLTLKEGAVLLQGLKAQSGHTIGEYLAPGTAYALYDIAAEAPAVPLMLVQGDVEETQENLVIVAHTHHFDANSKCQDCGYVCGHESKNMDTGKCNACSKQLYQAKIGTTGYATLDAALAEAQKTENCTVTILCDIALSRTAYFYLTRGTFTLNLNGHKLAQPSDISAEDDALFRIAGADITIEGTTAGSEISDRRLGTVMLMSGKLSIHGGKIRKVALIGGELTITDGEFGEVAAYPYDFTAAISGGTFERIVYGEDDGGWEGSLLTILKSGYAFFDVDSKEVVDASGMELKNVYVSTHTHTKRDGYKTCACGYTFPYAAVTQAPEPLTLTYSGQTQALATAGTAQSGTLVYSLTQDGAYTSVIPTGKNAGSYTVYYKVQGDDGHLDTAVQSLNVTIAKKDVTITGTTAEAAKTYDGTTTATITASGTIQGNLDGEDLTIIPGRADYPDKNVGTDKTVTFTGFALSGSAKDNYRLTAQPTPVTADITTREIVAKITPQDKDFDGGDSATADVQLQNVVTGDDLSLKTGTVRFGGRAAGEHKLVFTGYALEGRDKDNYILTLPETRAAIRPTDRYLDLTDLGLTDPITIDGKLYPIEEADGTRFVALPEEGDLFTTYTYGGSGHPYPTGMHVYTIERKATGSTATEIPDFRNLLTYAGCSIRISGKQGIRMITSLDEATKKALTGKGLNGYTLEEYGTVVSWTENLAGENFLRLGEVYARSNYAYLKGRADPVFARKNGVMQYTNVLLLGNLTEADYDKDLTLRAYITLRNSATGETVTLYGGTVTRSIYYVAKQNADTYKPGTTGYKFVHKIIDAVENP